MGYGSSIFVYFGSTAIGDDTLARHQRGYGQGRLGADAALSRTTEAGVPTVASMRLPHVSGLRACSLVRGPWRIAAGVGAVAGLRSARRYSGLFRWVRRVPLAPSGA